MGLVFKLPRVSILDAVKGIWRCNTSMSFSFEVLSPTGELQTKKVEPTSCIKKMQLIDPTWSFIDATSSMVFHI